eukprot:sb/3477002/
MTTSYEETTECNKALSAEILRTKNLYHNSIMEGDDERARHKLTIQVGGKDIDIPSEQRLRELEMELAKTKLCLVEANCKAQEYEHDCSNLREKLKNIDNSGVLTQLKARLNR